MIGEEEDQLYVWQSPDELVRRFETLSRSLGSSAMLRPGHAFRENFLAGRLAQKCKAKSVRLLREVPGQATPDFEIIMGSFARRFETTEIDTPGRRRGDEYRQPSRVSELPFIDKDVVTDKIKRLTSKKSAKKYAECHGLLMYLNLTSFQVIPDLTWDDLLGATEPASAVFREVWIFRNSGAMLWFDGVPQREIAPEEL